ncbi:protein phosphatase regulatory subunit Gac1 [Pochonia chlamydosporia 170]|uniref:Protein phosphatase regulatory subunit Gac1 n=1 Tax=Pochonia chlamydosporia 170 TaxID=1380566 RepID=A0A179F6J9_METCM|nr:protein phosphatase regulatory subunit Gac1 [Pochonia chlamydosporia 170]OAQ60729.1 protein phosphatase regulatory subunit Gac1 [Pochonia chlamydosporia 170]
MPYTQPSSQLAQVTGKANGTQHKYDGKLRTERSLPLNKPASSGIRTSPRKPAMKAAATAICTAKKLVRFKDDLEHVRVFRKSDCPEAANQDTPNSLSVVSQHLSVTVTDSSPHLIRRFEGNNCILNNYKQSQVEEPVIQFRNIRISRETMSAIGVVTVKNLAFQKHVFCRFTLDGWTTQSDIAAEYVYPVRQTDRNSARDSFVFSIPISDYCRLGNNTLEFCIRYCVNGQEYWANNDSNNFVVFFNVDREEGGLNFAEATPEEASNTAYNEFEKPGDLQEKQKHVTRCRLNKRVPAAPTAPSHCTPDERLRIGALGRRYDLSVALSTLCPPRGTSLRSRIVPIMRTGPIGNHGGFIPRTAKTFGGVSAPAVIK